MYNLYQYQASKNEVPNDTTKVEDSNVSNKLEGSLPDSQEAVVSNEQEEPLEKTTATMLYVGFNQTNTLFSVGTQRGFHIFSADAAKQQSHYIFKSGGIGIIDILFHSNIFALVGGGPNPAFPPNRVMIWDDQRKQCIAQVDCAKKVRAVRLHKNLVIVVLEDQIIVYDYNLKEIFRRETASNPKGIYAVCPDTDNIVLAFPAVQTGMVRVEHISIDKSKFVKAHKSGISQIALNRDGTRLATASETGTLIRIFDTETGDQLREVRRGTSSADIFSIAFSNDSKYLCACSDHGTVHLFFVGSKEDAEVQNRTSSWSFVTYVVDVRLISSEWSFAEYKGLTGPAICCFGNTNDIVRVITGKGEYIVLQFDLKSGGEPKQINRIKIPWHKLDDCYAEDTEQ